MLSNPNTADDKNRLISLVVSVSHDFSEIDLRIYARRIQICPFVVGIGFKQTGTFQLVSILYIRIDSYASNVGLNCDTRLVKTIAVAVVVVVRIGNNVRYRKCGKYRVTYNRFLIIILL